MKIPTADRAKIEAYWRSKSAPPELLLRCECPQGYKPKFFLHKDAGLPRVFKEGHQVHFCPRTLKEMGDDFAVLAILHELAHVFYYSQGEPNHWVDRAADRPVKNAATQACEQLVDSQLRKWNLDQLDLLEWRDGWEADLPNNLE